MAAPGAVRKLLGRTLLQTGRAEAAKYYLDAVLREGPDAEASWLLSRAYLVCGDTTKAAQLLAASGAYAMADPLRVEPAMYTGAKGCAECHATIYRAQQKSRHARTLVLPKDLAGLPLPAQPVKDSAVPGLTHSLRRDGDAIRMESRLGNDVRTAVVEYALGSDHHGQTMIGRDEEGKARVFRLSVFGSDALWDLTPNVPPPRASDPGEVIGQYLSPDSVVKCVDCHVTSFAPPGIVAGPRRPTTELAVSGVMVRGGIISRRCLPISMTWQSADRAWRRPSKSRTSVQAAIGIRRRCNLGERRRTGYPLDNWTGANGESRLARRNRTRSVAKSKVDRTSAPTRGEWQIGVRGIPAQQWSE